MKIPLWKLRLLSLIDGVESHLCPSAVAAAREKLAEARRRILDQSSCQRGKVEAYLEVLLASRPYFRAATRRALGADLEQALARLETQLSGLQRDIATARAPGQPEGQPETP